MKVIFGRKKIDIDVKNVGFLNKGIGLMFRSSKTKPLLFNFSRDARRTITSLFVFFDFIIVFLDDKNRVIEVRKIKPFVFNYTPEKKFRKFIEIPVDKKYSKEIDFFVGKENI